jgi:hypothetical protein
MLKSAAILLTCYVLMTVIGCDRSPYAGMTQGKVEYDLEIDAENMPPMISAMMPSEAITWFSDGKSCTVIESAGGIFEYRLLFDPDKKVFANLFSSFNGKVADVTHSDSLRIKYPAKKPAVEYTGVKKQIAGIMCEEAIIKGDSGSVFRVFFTDELEVKSPNMGALLTNFEGFMMEYQIEMKGMRMKLKARKITADKPDAELFTIPKEYEIKKNLFN